MKKMYCLLLVFAASGVLWAQAEAADSVKTEDEVKESAKLLDEVTVKAARVVRTDDGMRVFPSQTQLEASTDGFSLLQKLSLPGVKVDEVMHTVSAPELIGSVQVRINDVVVSAQDLLSLEMPMVQSVEFITSPGLRYGEGVAYVIDIHVLRPKSGYVVGGDVLQSLNRRRNSDNVYFRMNKGKSEFAFDYDFSWTDFRHSLSEQTTDYQLNDGTTTSVVNRDIFSHSPNINNDLSLKYSLSEDGKYLFLATLSQSFANSPSNHNQMEVITPMTTDTVNVHSKDRSNTTQLDLYFNLHLPHAQTLTANAVGTFIGSRYRYSSDAVSAYLYHTKGRTYSLTSEALYENRLRPFTLSAGVKVHQQYSCNQYSGDVLKDNPLRESGQYAYMQIRGKLFSPLSYKVGMGVSHLYYSQTAASFNYWLPRPMAMLNWRLSSSLSVRYNFELTTATPRLSYLNDVTTVSERVLLPSGLIEELRVGNPHLKSSPRTQHTLTVTGTAKAFDNTLTLMYRDNHHTWMQDITRQSLPEGTTQYLFDRSNQRSIKMLYMSDGLNLHLLPDVLDLSLGGIFLRCLNFGDHYTHCRTTLMGEAGLQCYLGKFTISANYDSGWHFLEGESKGDHSHSLYFATSYRLGKLSTLSLYWQHPFAHNLRTQRAELLNRYIHQTFTAHSRDLGNMLSLNLTFNLSHGRKYNTQRQTLQNTNVDAGVVKHE